MDVGDGSSTSFWHDLWADGIPLRDKYPALYGHYASRVDSVQGVIEAGLSNLCSRASPPGQRWS